MNKLIFLAFLSVSFVVVGCSTPNHDGSAKFQQCRAVYANKSGKEICRTYWSNSDLLCDEAMRSLMGTAINSDACRAERPNVQSSSVQNYNQAKSATYQYCQSKYIRSNTQAICQSYWSNSDMQCDQAMRDVIESRGMSVSGNSCYGVYVPQQRQTPNSVSNSNSMQSKTGTDSSITHRTCTREYSSTSTSNLCQTYWLNADQKCDSAIREIITERGINISGSSCFVDRNKYTQNPPSNKSDSPTAHTLNMPNTTSSRCENFIRKIISNSNPIESACRYRYNSLEEETIVCRKELNSLINDNSKGVGTNSATCGLRQ